jgi:hypothetical protein
MSTAHKCDVGNAAVALDPPHDSYRNKLFLFLFRFMTGLNIKFHRMSRSVQLTANGNDVLLASIRNNEMSLHVLCYEANNS